MKTYYIYLLLLFLLCENVLAQGDRHKVLIITGGHEFDRDAFFGMFDSFQDIEYKEAIQPEANQLFTTTDIRDYSVIVFYDMTQEITREQQAGFQQLVNRGIGLVFLHHAIVSYQQWDFYSQVLGGRFVTESAQQQSSSKKVSTYQHDTHFMLKIADRLHAITKGIDSFEVHDEVYGDVEIQKNITPLITTRNTESMNTVVWCHKVGAARSVYIQPGHGPEIFYLPEYRQLVYQAIKWSAM